VTCTQPGCGGTIQDGYCDTCGIAVGAAVSGPASAGSSGPASAGSSGSAPWSGPSGTSGVTSGGSVRSRSRGRGSVRSVRGRLGAGLVEIPPVPYRDPSSAVLADPQVPEGKRYCGGCDQPVGRGRDGRPGLAEGFCRNCGTRFSFTPKLALAFAAEAAGDPAVAGHYFRLVWTVDRSCISAAFGLARACLAAGDRPGAIAALAGVPSTSSNYATAQVAAVKILVSGSGPGQISGDDLRQADGRLGRLVMDDVRREQLTVEILRAALDWCTTGQPAGNGPILGCEPNARAVRFGLERSYRALARLTPDEDRKIELVDMANAIRPRTLT
jgi:hypothetical protein